MSDQNFKLQDSVQLLHGYTPTMTISQINEESQEALCVWLETKSQKIHKEWLPLNVLKKTPEKTPLTKDDLYNSIGYKH